MVIFYWSDPTSTPVSCGSDSLVFFDVKWILCACKLCPEIQPQIRRVLSCPHSLPLFSNMIVSSWQLYMKFDSPLFVLFLHMKRSPSFGPGSKTRRVRPAFVLCHSKIPPPSYFFPVVLTACFGNCMGGSSDCGDICIAWDLHCWNASEMYLGTFLSSIEKHMNHIWVS